MLLCSRSASSRRVSLETEGDAGNENDDGGDGGRDEEGEEVGGDAEDDDNWSRGRAIPDDNDGLAEVKTLICGGRAVIREPDVVVLSPSPNPAWR